MIALQLQEMNTGLTIVKELADAAISKLPSVLTALGIFILGWIIAKLIAKLTYKLFRSLKIDRLSDRLSQIEFVSKTGIEVSLAKWLSEFCYYLVFFIFIVAAVEVLGQRQLTQLLTDLIAFIPRLLSAFAVLIFGILLSDKLRGILHTSLKSLNIPSAGLISKALFYFLVVNVFVVAMAQSGIDMAFLSSNLTVLIGGVALAFGLSYGLASKNIASNTISSFYAKEDIDLGDDITVDGTRGKVIHIGTRNITLKSEGKTTLIPFNQLTKNTITFHDK